MAQGGSDEFEIVSARGGVGEFGGCAPPEGLAALGSAEKTSDYLEN